MNLSVIPALSDNYIHLVADDGRAVITDPGEAPPVLDFIAEKNLQLEAVLITHRHYDHIGGLGEVLRRHPQASVYAPDGCGLLNAEILSEGDTVLLLNGALNLRVIATPGHTLEHIAYFGDGVLLCGDTLFACGCGRVFEGTMTQMRESLEKLAALPDDTSVYCGHEYTQSNIRFALTVDKENPALLKRADEAAGKRKKNEPTVPFSIGEDKKSNPFLRLDAPAVIAAVQKQSGCKPRNDDEVFSALRRWKDSF